MVKLLVFGLIGFFVICFLVCAIVYPELVGIAGKKAREIEGSHVESKATDDSEDQSS